MKFKLFCLYYLLLTILSTSYGKYPFEKVDNELYVLSNLLKSSLQFKVKPAGMDQMLAKLVKEDNLNVFFLCHLDKKGKFTVKINGLKGFTEIKKGLIRSFLSKYYQVALNGFSKKFKSIKFKQVKLSDYGYSGKHLNKPIKIDLLIKKNRLLEYRIMNSENLTRHFYKYKMIANKALVTEVTHEFSRKKIKLRELNKIVYRKYKGLNVIDFVLVQKINGKKNGKEIKIKFYDYK